MSEEFNYLIHEIVKLNKQINIIEDSKLISEFHILSDKYNTLIKFENNMKKIEEAQTLLFRIELYIDSIENKKILSQRISNDEYFIKICEIVALRSTCLKRKVGAVLVKDNKIIATGYNGAPSGIDHCTENTCQRKNSASGQDLDKCIAVHAEMNTIIQCALSGSITENSVLYCTNFPCLLCIKILINAKVKKIIYKDDYYHLHPGNEIYKKIAIEKYKG